jgi:hypothetical protein
MGHMKELDRRIRQGGDDAIAAACELAGLAKERRGYDSMKNATGDITDIVTVLRGVGFAAVPPSAGESASLLHYCVTHAADEIERLRGYRDAAEADLTVAIIAAERLRLTDEEREAVGWCVEMALHSATDCVAEIRTLRGLLERL